MRLQSVQWTAFAGVVFLLFAHSVYAAQAGTNYNIPADVLDSGGADVSKSNLYLLSDSIGESVIGYGSTENYVLNSGYRQPSASDVISVSCTDFVNLGSVVGTGQRSGSGTCTVYTDAYDGYRMVWQGGANNTNGLVGHWKFDETSGTTAYDLSGNGNNGTLTNGPVISTDTPSKYFSTRSVNFDGTNDFILATGASALKRDANQTWSMGGWYYIRNASGDIATLAQVRRSPSGGGYYLSYGIVGSTASTDYYDGAAYWRVRTTSAVPTNAWVHIMMTHDGSGYGGVRMYVNGVRVSTTVSNAGSPTNVSWTDTRMAIGGDEGATPIDGLADDVRIYNRSLSADAIRDLASKAPPGSLTASGSQTAHIPGIYFPSTGGLVGHWKMEETIASTVADSSGYNNDGTPAGAGGANNTPQPFTSTPGSTTFLTTRSLDFDGTDDYIENTSPSQMNATGAYTFSAWVKSPLPGAAKYYMYFWRGTSGKSDIEIYTQASSNDLIIAHNRSNGGTFDHVGFVDPPDDTYFHLAVVYSSGVLQAYYNGIAQNVTQNTTAMIAPLSSTNHAVRLGSANHTQFSPTYFKGQMDDVRFYNRALTAAEIKALYSEPQAWSVAATESAWGARLSSNSTDTDAKWGSDGGSEKWLNLGDGAYTVVRRPTATPLEGSVEYLEFRGEVGSSKVQTSGVYKGVASFTVVGY